MRLVPLDKTLLGLAIALERDPTTRRGCSLERIAAFRGWALLDGGTLIGAGGFVPAWHGRAEALMLVSSLASRRQIVRGVRIAREFLDKTQNDPAFARLEIYIRASAPWRASFAHALGFVQEAALPQWGPDGAEFCLYSRVRAAMKEAA